MNNNKFYGTVIWLMVILILVTLWTFRLRLTNLESPQYNRVTTIQSPTLQNIPPPNNKLQIHNASLVSLKGTKTRLISAYLEHRKSEKQVLVLAIARRSEKFSYVCKLRCDGKLHVSKGKRDIFPEHYHFQYGTASIVCPVPEACEKPSHVALAAHPNQPAGDKVYLEVKNQKPENSSFLYNFTVCFSVMYDFRNTLQLVQHLEMLQLLGVNRVSIYLTSCSYEVQRILDIYTKRGFVEVVPWSLQPYFKVSHHWQPRQGPGVLHYYGQVPALNDCLYKYMYQSKYVALHDLDELILPRTVNSWTEMMPLLEQNYGVGKSFYFFNNVYLTNMASPHQNDLTNPETQWKGIHGRNILAPLYLWKSEKEYRKKKAIVNPRNVFTMGVHDVTRSLTASVYVPWEMAPMHHIKSKKHPKVAADKLAYISALQSYKSELIPAVSNVLTEAGLLTPSSQ